MTLMLSLPNAMCQHLTSLQRNLLAGRHVSYFGTFLFHDESYIQYLHDSPVPVVEQYLVLHARAYEVSRSLQSWQ